jgi:uncharacterized PurR-regulated membrane protein YhhQ (DUF165 family)
MLSASDLKRLDYGASRMRHAVFIVFILVGVCVAGAGSVHIWLATKLAEFMHVQLWELFGLKFDFKQSYSGTVVEAANHLSTGVRLISDGVVLVFVAFLFRAQARFYARLRAELQTRDA